MIRKLLLIAALAGCAEPTPENPTWDDVRPILMANCVRCHGEPSLGAAPGRFRLDVYYFDSVSGDRGAASMAEFIVARAVHRGDMPPIGPTLSDRQHEILERWAQTKAIGTPAAPTAVLLEGDGQTADESATFVIDVRHPDGAGVRGVLTFDGVQVARLRGGRQVVTIDTGVLAEVNGLLAADLFVETASVSEPEIVTVELGELTVDHGDAPVAPVIVPMTLGDETVFAEADATAEVTFRVLSDLATTGTLTAERRGQVVTVAANIMIPPPDPMTGPITQTVPVDLSLLPEDGAWRLTLTVSDGMRERSMTFGPVYVFHGASTSTFADVLPIFEARCAGCHSQESNRVDFGPDLTSSADAQSLRGSIYHRVVVTRDMPPPSAEELIEGFTPMTEEERAAIAEWIRGGAQP